MERREAERAREISRFFRVPLEEIAFVRAILEAEEGLAQLIAPDARRGEIELVIPSDRAVEAGERLAGLGRATGWIEIARPPSWSEPSG